MKIIFLTCFLSFIISSLIIAQDYTYAIVNVPKATIYKQKDTSSYKVIHVEEATILTITEKDITGDWVAITMSDSSKCYILKESLAFGNAASKQQQLKINNTTYILIWAKNGYYIDDSDYDLDYTPFLWDEKKNKAYLIRCLFLSDNNNILKYNDFDNQGADAYNNKILSVEKNILHLKNNKGGLGYDENDELTSFSTEKHIYMSVHKAQDGQFWAIHTFPNEKKWGVFDYPIFLSNKEYFLKAETLYNAEEQITYITPYLQDAKTYKSYPIYANPPINHEYLFDKFYIEFSSSVENSKYDSGYLMFAPDNEHLFIYSGSFSSGVFGEINIFIYELKMINGKIMAKELIDRRKTLQLSR